MLKYGCSSCGQQAGGASVAALRRIYWNQTRPLNGMLGGSQLMRFTVLNVPLHFCLLPSPPVLGPGPLLLDTPFTYRFLHLLTELPPHVVPVTTIRSTVTTGEFTTRAFATPLHISLHRFTTDRVDTFSGGRTPPLPAWCVHYCYPYVD